MKGTEQENSWTRVNLNDQFIINEGKTIVVLCTSFCSDALSFCLSVVQFSLWMYLLVYFNLNYKNKS